jgi:transcriptional regulator with XRE-family HTH domain
MDGGHWAAGTLIRLARMQKGLTQREVAERAGTSQSAIAAYERGHKSPNFDTLVRIIRAIGLELKIRLTEPDGVDDWLRAYESNLPSDVVARMRETDREATARGRSRRDEERERRWDRALAAAGCCNSGLGDLSEQHDKYLAEAFAE